jgi:hypothetical protein
MGSGFTCNDECTCAECDCRGYATGNPRICADCRDGKHYYKPELGSVGSRVIDARGKRAPERPS